LGDEEGVGVALYNLGMCLVLAGREQEGVSAVRESVSFAHALENLALLSCSLVLLGSVAAQHGASRQGAKLVGSADALRARTGMVLTGVEAELYEATVDDVRRGLTRAEYDTASGEGRAMSLDEAVEYALASID
jgi:hypothetical protein